MRKFEFIEMLHGNDCFTVDKTSDFLYNSHDGIFIVDRNGRLILANKAVADMIGVPYSEIVGNSVESLVSNGVYIGSPSIEAIRKKKTVTGLVKTRDGVEIMSTSKPVYDESGKLEYVITNCRPMSVLKKFFDKYDKKKPNLLDVSFDQNDLKTKYIYSSDVMKEILKNCYYAAQSDCPMLLLGQTGTGKGVMAKYIHNNSLRRDKKFVDINCAALPENLLESELFGYEKGAFTGANNEGKAGLLEIANGGTLFLDEVGEMSTQLQAKLLKVLDSGFLRKVGGTIYHKVNVRIVSATNRDLAKMIKEGTFREDLFYRLNVITIRIPALKERKDELSDIAEHLLENCNEKYAANKKITSSALKLLKTYDWPGNIRQLDNFIQRVVILSMEETVINEGVLKPLLQEEKVNSCYTEDTAIDDLNSEHVEDGTLKTHLENEESRYIRKRIRECGGSVTKAALELGIHRTTIYKKLNITQNESVYS